MKNLLPLFLFLSISSFGSAPQSVSRSSQNPLKFLSDSSQILPETFSVTGGMTGTGSEIGYLVGITSPYAREMPNTAFSLDLSQYAMPHFTQSYIKLTASMITRILDIHHFGGAYTRVSVFGIMDRPFNLGISPMVGIEYKLPDDSHFTFFSEVGLSWPLVENFYAQGVQVSLGFKYYL